MTKGLSKHIVEVQHSHLCTRHAGNVKSWKATAPSIADVNLHLAIIQLTIAQHATELVAGFRARVLPNKGVQNPLLGHDLGAGPHVLSQAFSGHVNGALHQVAYNLLHVAANVTHFRELCCFHLDERRLGQFGQAAGNLGFADPRGADHQYVFRQHLFAHGVVQLLASPAIAECNGH